MVTDVEMSAMEALKSMCKDRLARDVLGMAQEMLGALDVDEYYDAPQEELEAFLQEYADEINDTVKNAAVNGSLPKRMVGDWEVLASFKYGDREIFIGENPNPEQEIERYLVGDIVSNELFDRYENCIGSDMYGEIAELYSQRMQQQIEKVKAELAKFPYDRSVIGKESVDSIQDRNIEGELVVIDPKAMKREEVGADRQLWLAEGGFGCSPEGRGRKVLCKNVFTGNTSYWQRSDILGTLKAECVPEWVKDRMTDKPIEVLFTFGSWEKYPFQMGYVSITAPSVKEACAEFRRNWPDRTEGCLNCADYYFEPESVAQLKESGNGAGCHKKIDITIPVIEGKSVDAVLQDAKDRTSGITLSGKQKEIEIEK